MKGFTFRGETFAPGTTVVVSQTRSLIGRNVEVRRTLEALGLGRIGASAVHKVVPSTVGMIRRVQQVLTVTSTSSR